MMKYDEIKYLRSFMALLVLITMKFFKQLRPKQLQTLGLYGQYKMQRFVHVLVEPKLNYFLNVSVSARPNNMCPMTSWTSQTDGFKMT